MTADDVRRILGPYVDPEVLSDILRTGASVGELVQAKAWAEADEALVNDQAPFPSGRVVELIEILEADRMDEDPD